MTRLHRSGHAEDIPDGMVKTRRLERRPFTCRANSQHVHATVASSCAVRLVRMRALSSGGRRSQPVGAGPGAPAGRVGEGVWELRVTVCVCGGGSYGWLYACVCVCGGGGATDGCAGVRVWGRRGRCGKGSSGFGIPHRGRQLAGCEMMNRADLHLPDDESCDDESRGSAPSWPWSILYE